MGILDDHNPYVRVGDLPDPADPAGPKRSSDTPLAILCVVSGA